MSEEYSMHWRCRICNKESSFTEKVCPNCGAQLLTYGEQVFEGKKPPKVDAGDILVEHVVEGRQPKGDNKRNPKPPKQQPARKEKKTGSQKHKQGNRAQHRGGALTFLIILLVLIAFLLRGTIGLLLSSEIIDLFLPTSPSIPEQTQPVDADDPGDTVAPVTDPVATDPADMPVETTEPADPTETEPPAKEPWEDNLLKADFKVSDYKYNFFMMGETTIHRLPSHVVFVDSLEKLQEALTHRITAQGEVAQAAWDVSEAQDGSVWAWYMETHLSDCTSACHSKCDYILYIGAEGGVNGTLVSTDMFADCPDLKYIDFRDCFYCNK